MAELTVDVANTSGVRGWTRGSQQKASAGSEKSLSVKLVLLGDAGVGKSSLALRFVRGEFCEHNDATIGAAFFTQTSAVDDQTVKLAIWDTAGQERYRCIAPMYYRDAQAAIVVFDVTSERSYERALSSMRELRERAESDIAVTLAANKCDLAGASSDLLEIARAYSEENGISFEETSARTGRGVHKMFEDIASQVCHVARAAGRYERGAEHGGGILLKRDDGRRLQGVCPC